MECVRAISSQFVIVFGISLLVPRRLLKFLPELGVRNGLLFQHNSGTIACWQVVEFRGDSVDENIRNARGILERIVEGGSVADGFGVEKGDVGGIALR